METYLGAPVIENRVDWGMSHRIFLFDQGVRERVRKEIDELLSSGETMQTPVYINGNKVGIAWLTPEGDDMVITELLIHEAYTSSDNDHHVDFSVAKEK